jgi:hypothetical protein
LQAPAYRQIADSDYDAVSAFIDIERNCPLAPQYDWTQTGAPIHEFEEIVLSAQYTDLAVRNVSIPTRVYAYNPPIFQDLSERGYCCRLLIQIHQPYDKITGSVVEHPAEPGNLLSSDAGELFVD